MRQHERFQLSSFGESFEDSLPVLTLAEIELDGKEIQGELVDHVNCQLFVVLHNSFSILDYDVVSHWSLERIIEK